MKERERLPETTHTPNPESPAGDRELPDNTPERAGTDHPEGGNDDTPRQPEEAAPPHDRGEHGLHTRVRTRRPTLLRRIEYQRLKRIRKHTIPAYSHCKNCGEKLLGMYCSRCGQYALDIEQPFWKYIRQYFENVYQFDSKVWLTLWLLFRRPGLLTREFNAGKINSYVHPFRLYMFISVIFFTIFFMFASDKALESVRRTTLAPHHMPDTVVTMLRAGTLRPDTCIALCDAKGFSLMLRMKKIPSDLIRIESPFGSRSNISRVTMPRMILDSCLYRTALSPNHLDEIASSQGTLEHFYREMERRNLQGSDRKASEVLEELEGLDVAELEYLEAFESEELLTWIRTFDPQQTPVYDWRQKHEEHDWMQKEWDRQNFINNLLATLSKWTPLFMMFLLPLFALLLRMVYRKQKMNYMQHFVHTIHINALFLLLIAVPIGIMFNNAPTVRNYPDLNTTITAFELFFALILLYMFLSSRTVYGEGWIKTLLKTLFVFCTFSVIAFALCIGLILWIVVEYLE